MVSAHLSDHHLSLDIIFSEMCVVPFNRTVTKNATFKKLHK